DPLRRHRALTALISAARVILDPELPPLQRRRRNRVERLARRARGDRGKTQPARSLAEIQSLMPREVVEPLRERAQVLLEQAAASVLEQPPHDRERLELVRREPEARQLVRFAAHGLAVFVAADVTIKLNWGVEMVLHRANRTQNSGFRAFELRFELLE